MDWPTIFYITATVFLVIATVFILGLSVVCWLVYRHLQNRVQSLERSLKLGITQASVSVMGGKILSHLLGYFRKR